MLIVPQLMAGSVLVCILKICNSPHDETVFSKNATLCVASGTCFHQIVKSRLRVYTLHTTLQHMMEGITTLVYFFPYMEFIKNSMILG